MWLLALLFYFAGINELIVKFLSFKLNIDVYEYLKNYSNSTRYLGLQLPFIIYTFFFGALSSFVYFYDKIKKVNKNEFEFTIKVYLILSFAFFVFGFGPWVNRIAVMCWLFIPILQIAIISQLNLDRKILNWLSILFFFTSLSYFILFRLGVLDLI